MKITIVKDPSIDQMKISPILASNVIFQQYKQLKNISNTVSRTFFQLLVSIFYSYFSKLLHSDGCRILIRDNYRIVIVYRIQTH
jgi:hypothetical protein